MLDFYDISDNKREDILFSMTEFFFDKISSLLESNNIEIDRYGTTRLYGSHIDKLLLLLESNGLNKSDFYFFLAKSKNGTLIVEGD